MTTTTVDDNKPAALSAFLSPASRILESAKSDSVTATKTAASPVNKLSPEQISLKIASMLKPGPPFYSTVSSADLIDNLGSASIMRCDDLQPGSKKDRLSTAKGWLKGLTSFDQDNGDGVSSATATASPWTGVGTVWSALNGLPSGANAFEIPATHAEDAVESKAAAETSNDDGLWSGIMFACDLDGSNVELTKSCVVPTKVLTEANYFKGNYSALFTTIGAGKAYKWDDWSTASTPPPAQGGIASMLTLYTMPTVEMWSWPSWVPYLGNKDEPGGAKPSPPSVTPPAQGGGGGSGLKRVWVPSTTKVSVHATWWGYTIYLPSVVLPGLEADVDQAEKIALIVHTVLTTILDKASSLPIPAALQAAVLLLKAIAPSTSYIATFIGWSWDQIKSFDKGQGVELTATWLLPIALIPHTWDAATAPTDTNGDGTPDGPPQKPNVQPVVDGGQTKKEDSPVTAEPATSVPAEPEQPPSSTPVEQETVVAAPEPEQVAVTTEAKTEDQEGEKDVEVAHQAEAAITEEQSEDSSKDGQAGEEGETIDGIPEEAKTAQSLLTLEPDAVDGVSLSEEAIQELAKVPEPTFATQTNTIAEEDEEQEEEVTAAVKEEEKVAGEEDEETEEGVGDAKEDDEGVKAAAEEVGGDEEEEEIANHSATQVVDSNTTEPNSPADSVGTPNDGDALGRGKADVPAIGDAEPVTPAPANDGVEWQNDPSAGTVDSENTILATTPKPIESTKKQQFRGGARKLFGKMTNKV